LNYYLIFQSIVFMFGGSEL